MKRFLMTVCLMVLLVLTLAVPAMAAEGEHTHCICNGKLAGHAHSQIPYDTVVTTEAELKTAVTTGTEGTVNILLGADITLDEEIGITGKTVNLCLGSYKLTMSGSKARLTANAANSDVNYRGTLNITACGGGSIVAASGCRVGTLYTYKGYLNVYGGTVDATNTASGAGGAVIVGYAGDEFTLYDGEIIGSLKGTTGGAIYCKVAGTVHIVGGTVRDGHATTKGGNIYMEHDSAVLKVSGGTISGGQATTLGGNIDVLRGSLEITGGTVTGGSAGGDTTYPGHGGAGICMEYNATSFVLSGSAKIYGNTGVVGDENAVGEDVRLNGNTSGVKNQITLGQWKGNGTNPALRLFKGVNDPEGVKVVTFAEGVLDPIAMKAYFTVVNEDCQLAMLDNTGFTLQDAAAHIHCICGGQAVGVGGHSCLDLIYTAGTAASDLSAGGNVFLGDDLTLSEETTVGGNTLNLCLHDKTITMQTNGRLTANSNGGDMTKKGTVNVTACAGGSVVAASECRTGLLYTYKGTLNLYGGTVDASACKAQAGGAVTVGFAEDVFNMYGGTLVANTSSTRGGAIYANNTKSGYSGDYKDVTLDRFANIYGGQISGTTSEAAGKIYMLNGILTVNGTSVIGGEPVIADTAEVVYNGVSLNGSYNTIYTMADAVAAAGSTDYIMLPGDLDGQTISKSVYLDLNGHSLTNLTVNSGAEIKLIDTTAASYAKGTGSVKLADGTSANFARACNTDPDTYGRNLRFLTIREADGTYSAHRIYLAVKSTVLYPALSSTQNPAVGFRTVLRCDEVVKDYVAAYGLYVTADGMTNPGYSAFTDVAAWDGTNDNSKVTGLGFSSMDQAATEFSGKAYLILNDSFYADVEGKEVPALMEEGKAVTSSGSKLSLKGLVVNANTNFDSMSAAQKANLKTMYDKWEDTMGGWELDNIAAYNPNEE